MERVWRLATLGHGTRGTQNGEKNETGMHRYAEEMRSRRSEATASMCVKGMSVGRADPAADATETVEESASSIGRLEGEFAGLHLKLENLEMQMTSCLQNLSEFHQDHSLFTRETRLSLAWHHKTGCSKSNDDTSMPEPGAPKEPDSDDCILGDWLEALEAREGSTGSFPVASRSMPEKSLTKSSLRLTPPEYISTDPEPLTPLPKVTTFVSELPDKLGRVSKVSKSQSGISYGSEGGMFNIRSNNTPADSVRTSRLSSGSRISGRLDMRRAFKRTKVLSAGHSALFETLNRVRVRSDFAKQVWMFTEDPDLVWGGRLYMRFVSLLIFISAVLPVLQSQEQPPFDRTTVSVVEALLDVVFGTEVVVRLWACPNRVTFSTGFYNVLDFVASVLMMATRFFSADSLKASLHEAEASGDLLLAAGCGALPVLRLLKLLRRFETFHLILKAVRSISEAMPVMLYILAIIVVTFATAIYIVEPRTNIETLAESLWMTIVTAGTVGYGDVVPSTTLGTCLTSGLVIISSLYMAIPIGIVGKTFATVWDDRDRLLLMYRYRSRFLSSGYKACDVPTMFYTFDTDGDGQLSMEEFLQMMNLLQIELPNRRLVELFEAFDADGNGSISDQEFTRALFPDTFAEIYGNFETEARETQEGL